MAELDVAWAKEDWPAAVRVLGALKAAFPEDPLVAEKYVAAHINAGDAADSRGDRAAAAQLYAAAGTNPVAAARLSSLTPTATATSIADARAREQAAYAAYMAPYLQAGTEGLEIFNQQVASAGNSIVRLVNPDWRARMVLGLSLMKYAGGGMQEYEPVPPHLKPLDDLMVAVGKDMQFVADEVALGIDNLDASRFERATTRLKQMNVRMRQARAELERIAPGRV